MESYRPKRAGGRLFLILVICLQMAYADTVTNWVGGAPSCATCWNQAANWNPTGVPNGAYSVTIGLTGNQPVLNTGVSIDNLSISGSASLSIANAQVLTVNTVNTGGISTISNAGILTLGSAGNNTDLALSGTNGVVNLSGTGTLTLSNSISNRIYANSSGMTLTNSSTIQGAGTIGVVGSALTLVNTGIINANQTAGLSVSGTIDNTSGLLQATNGGTLTLGGSINNAGSSISATGASTNLQLTNVNINNTSGTISLNGNASIGTLNGATITGGTLQALNGAQFQQAGSFSTLGGTVALNGALNVSNASGLTLNAGTLPMTLNVGAGGGINLNGGANNTDLALTGTNGTVNLNGPVTMSSSINNRIYANSGGMTLNNNSTIQGAGTIGVVGSALLLNNTGTGVINASQGVGISLNGAITNAGLLEATNTSTLNLDTANVTNTGIIAATGLASTVQLGGVTISGGTLQTTGISQFLESNGFATLKGTIAMNAAINVANANGLVLNATGGPVTLNFGTGGALNLNAAANNTDLQMLGTGGTVNLNGPVTLSNSVNNRIYAGNSGMTLNNSGAIQGAGQIGVVGSPLTLVNNGSINANLSAGLAVSGAITNTSGLLEATNGGTLTLGGSVNNTGSSISATGANTNLQLTNVNINNTNGTISLNGSGSVGTLNGATITGGTLQSLNGAQFQQTGSFSTLVGTVALNGTLNVTNASGLTLNTAGGPMTLNIGGGGGLNLNGAANNTDLALSGAGGTVNLNGPVTLSNSAANRIYANSGGMTLNNNATIQGAGTIGTVGSALIINNGSTASILANQSAGLSLNGTINNLGLLGASNGSTLTLSNAVINNNGGGIGALGSSSTVQLNNTSIAGGMLFQGSNGGQILQSGGFSTLSGSIALNAPLNVANASGLILNAASGPFTLTGGSGGVVNLNGTANNTDIALSGTGGTVNLNAPVTLSNSAANRIYANNAGMTLNNGSIIQGAGQIGAVGAAMVFNNQNSGLIVADQASPLTIGAATFTNGGTLQAISGSTLNITSPTFTNFTGTTLAGGTYVVGGIIEFNNANIVNNAATILMVGPGGEFQDQSSHDGLRGFDNNMAAGVFSLESGAEFTIGGAFSNAGSIDIFGSDLFGASVFLQSGGTTQVDGTLAASAVDINGGHLKGTGTITGAVSVGSGGAVDPGDSPGTLTVSGSYTQSASGALDLEFAGSGPGQFDVLDISGAATLDGTLNLIPLSGFTPLNGEVFDVMNFASRTGTFATVNGLDLGDGFTFQVEYNATNVSLLVNGPQQTTPEPGSWAMLAIGAGAIALSRRRKTGIRR